MFFKKIVVFPDNKPFFVRREGTSGPRIRTQLEKVKSNIYNRAARTGDCAYMYMYITKMKLSVANILKGAEM